MPRDITGDEGRCRPRKNAESCQTSFDPHVSEWGNPMEVTFHDHNPSKVGL
jgi:hypothetical protein